MFKRKKYLILLFLLVFFPVVLFAENVNNILRDGGMPNPSALYCTELGYEFVIIDTPEGQKGICKFSDLEQAPAWDFLRGEEAINRSYCSQEGYEMKIVDDSEKCGIAYVLGRGCLMCVLEDGEEVESFSILKAAKEGEKAIEELKNKFAVICNNDSICLSPETSQNCPGDCLKNDEQIQQENVNNINTDNKSENKIGGNQTFNIQVIFFIVFVVLIILIIILAYIFLIRKKVKIEDGGLKIDNNVSEMENKDLD